MNKIRENMKQFISFVRKEFYHVFRDRKTLLILFGLPIVQIFLFGFALTNEIKNAQIAVCDYAKDEASTRITRKLEENGTFLLKKSLLTHAEIEEAFKGGKIKMVVVFPTNFHQDLLHQGKAQVQLIADASDPNTATSLISYATSIVREYQQETAKNQSMTYTIVPETRMLYNPELKGAINFVPGIMALVLMLVCVLMTAVSIVKEKEMGTMEILLVSPFNPFLVIVVKMFPYLALSLVNLAVILIMSVTCLGVPVNGSVLLLVAESTLLIVCALSMGLLISNITNSQQVAMLVSLMGMMLPVMLFTGFMFPLENMPTVFQILANVFPSKWYYIIVKAVMIKGLGFSAIWKETLILCLMTFVFLYLSLKNFKTRLE